MPSSRGSSALRDRTHVSCLRRSQARSLPLAPPAGGKGCKSTILHVQMPQNEAGWRNPENSPLLAHQNTRRRQFKRGSRHPRGSGSNRPADATDPWGPHAYRHWKTQLKAFRIAEELAKPHGKPASCFYLWRSPVPETQGSLNQAPTGCKPWRGERGVLGEIDISFSLFLWPFTCDCLMFLSDGASLCKMCQGPGSMEKQSCVYF